MPSINKPRQTLNPSKASYVSFVREIVVEESANPYENERIFEARVRETKMEEQKFLESLQTGKGQYPAINPEPTLEEFIKSDNLREEHEEWLRQNELVGSESFEVEER